MRACPTCGTANRADATYCNTCGATLFVGAHAAPPGHAIGFAPATQQTASTGATGNGQAQVTNATGRLPPQSTLNGRYLILKNAGQGGMAAVYKATDLKSRRMVAIKEMSQDGLSPEELREALESFDAEARLLRGLRHPNLPRVYETFAENARNYLVMDFIEGQTLEERQQAAQMAPLPEADVLSWARQICAVLHYLHTQPKPIIFRDLKPANIMLATTGEIKLIDFGIARVFAPGRSRDTQALGTPGFAPPEQYGKAQTDSRADIYALGCTLYQLLTGYDPATTPFQLPPVLSRNAAISPQTAHAIERATQLDRERRFPTALDFARELANAPTAPRGWARELSAAAVGGGSFTQQGARPTAPQQAPSSAAAGATRAAQGGATQQQQTVGAGNAGARSAASAVAPLAAAVVVQPHEVNFGRIPRGQKPTLAISVTGQGGARVRGRITSLEQWLTIDQAQFDGASTVVRLTADTNTIAVAGLHRSSVQITCDGQYLFVPVKIEVLAGAMPQRPNAAPTAQHGAVRPSVRPVASGLKHQPSVRRPRWLWFLTTLLGGFIITAEGLRLGQGLLAAHPAIGLTAPVALGLLAAATVVGSLGATIMGGHARRLRRYAGALIGGLVGLLGALSADSTWLWRHVTDLASVMSAQVVLPSDILTLVPALVAVGVALGVSIAGSSAGLAVIGFVWRSLRSILTIALLVAGGWVGYVMTQGIACLTPLAVIAGVVLAFMLSRMLALAFPRAPRPSARNTWRTSARNAP